MTPLRAKMITDMQLHRLAPGTQALYLREVANFATFYGRSPEGFVANFAQEVMKGQLPLSVGGIRRPARRIVRPQ